MPVAALPAAAIKTEAAATSFIIFIDGCWSFVIMSHKYSIAVFINSSANTNAELAIIKSHSVELISKTNAAIATINNTNK